MTKLPRLEVTKPVLQPVTRDSPDPSPDSPKPASLPANELGEFALEENDESLESMEVWKRRLFQPEWFVSFTFHLAVFLALAIWIIPNIGRDRVVVFGEQIPQPDVEDVSFEAISFENDEIEIETDVLEQELEPIDLPVEVEPVQTFEPANNEPTLGPMVEHDAQFLGGTGDEVVGLSDSQAQAARNIQRLVREAGGQQGVVQFSLAWKTADDVDLHVIAPSGERIYFDHRNSQCRGRLDVDQNADSRDLTDKPVENIRWLRQAQAGRYTVIAHLYRPRTFRGNAKFTLVAKTGKAYDLKEGAVKMSERLIVYRYIYVPDSISERLRKRQIKQFETLQEKEEAKAQKMLEKAIDTPTREQALLIEIARNYPHTDAAIEALRRLESKGNK